MRVALNGLFLNAPATGTGEYLRELVRALQTLAPADEFSLFAPQSDSTAPARVVVAPTWMRAENLAKVEFEQLTFPRAARRQGYTLAHVPHFGPPLVPTLPTVVTIHDLIPVILPAYRGSSAVQLYTRLARAGARRAQAILADSHASARDIQEQLQIPRERVHVVYLAADRRFCPGDPQEIARVRSEYRLPERMVLYLGGFDVRKNVERVIQAFAALQTERRAGWKLVVAGKLPAQDTSFFPDPRRIAAENGVADGVQFLGFVSERDKPALYAAARILVFPSRYEGFGLPPLEAMACGTPVICADTSCLPEIVGAAGVLCGPDDTGAWVQELRALLGDDREWQARRAAGLAQAQRFTWERTAQETLAVYRAVV